MCMIEVVSVEFPWGDSIPDDAVKVQAKMGILPARPTDMADPEWRLIKRMCCLDPSERVTNDAVVVHLSSLIEQLDMTQLCPSIREHDAKMPYKKNKNRVSTRGGALLSVLTLATSSNELLSNYVRVHLLAVHVNRGARSEQHEISAVVTLLTNGDDQEKALAAQALADLSLGSPDNKTLIASAGAIGLLVALVPDGNDFQKE
ncbi:hypothetical protein FI667_g5267, partial [Globisporangium splendens]